MKKHVIWSLFLIAFSSQTLADNKSLIPNHLVESQGQSRIELGVRLQNPYSVENMREAFTLYHNATRTSTLMPAIRATHQYIEIMPSTEAHLQVLDALDAQGVLTLHDYPLDHAIDAEGDYYVMPVDENDLYHPVYTLIPKGYQFSSPLPFTVLEDVYEPTEEQFDVESLALAMAGWDTELDCARGVDCNDPEELLRMFQQPRQERLFGSRYRPHGYVKVRNTETGGWDNLKRAKISIGRGIWWRYTHTDNNGHFVSPKKYRGKVRIRAKWRSNIATIRKSWNELLGIQVSDHMMTIKKSSNGRTKYIEQNDERLWYKGTVHNGLVKYNDYVTARGVNEPIHNANVWVWKNGSGAASTPMLFRYGNLPQIIALANIGASNVWDVLANALAGFAIQLVPPHLRPDQIYSGLKRKKVNGQINTAKIQQIVLHESAHYSHAEKAGSYLWAKLFAAELANSFHHGDSYVDGSQPSYTRGRLIALAEGWATFLEYKAMNFYYDKAFEGEESYDPVAHMEGFDMYTRPMSEDRSDNQSWFLTGLMWDIHDSSNDSSNRLRNGTSGANIGFLTDELHLQDQGVLYPVFRGLRSDVEDACEYGQYLENVYNPGPAIETLFASYDYDCVDAGPGGGGGNSIPGTPGNFNITTYGGGINVLNWLPVGQADNYEVWRSFCLGCTFNKIATINGHSYQANVFNNTYYRVRACNNLGCSGYTAARLAYFQACGGPGEPPCE
ncbi:hypothetical protein [Marinicella sp. W31]|uniref:hypothetical protein n=1 Tax=Marinicella sp. W31 TaxID=3023713 RepID=UPI003756A699